MDSEHQLLCEYYKKYMELSKKFQNEKSIFANSHLVVSEIMMNFRSNLFPDKFTALLRVAIFTLFVSVFAILGSQNAFSYDGFIQFLDVNECTPGNLCDYENVHCKNLIFTGRECFCNPGLVPVVDASSASVTACLPINECSIGTHNCHSTSQCVDSDTGFVCICATTSTFPSDAVCTAPHP